MLAFHYSAEIPWDNAGGELLQDGQRRREQHTYKNTMMHPVPSAFTLFCDKCHASFFFNGHNVFGFIEETRARASVLDWLHIRDLDY